MSAFLCTSSRRAVAAAFVAVMFVSAACGNQTGATDVGSVPVQAPAQGLVQHAPMSADAAEREAQRLAEGRHTPTSADAAERRLRAEKRSKTHPDTVERWSQDPRLRD